MVLGIAGSRSIDIPIPEELMPEGIDLIITGGARGIDKAARDYAHSHNIPVTEILPEYNLYGRSAPLKRNELIINKADVIYVFWDGKSRGSEYVIKRCNELDKYCKTFLVKDGKFTPLK